MKLYILFLMYLLFAQISWAQLVEKPIIGKPCPDFNLTDVTYHEASQVRPEDFKGKWLMLDFWSTSCSTCIKSLPKINQLQQLFQNDVKFLLIGKNDKRYNRNIRTLYESLRERQNLNLTVAYDSMLGPRWGISSLPHIVIIDPEGIVRHITDGRDLQEDKIRGLINGKAVSFFPKEISRHEFDPNNVKPEQVLYRSILVRWNGERQNGGVDLAEFVNRGDEGKRDGYQLAMVNLFWLYNTAYFGRYYLKRFSHPFYGNIYPWPVLEMADKSLFEYDYKEEIGKGLYNYSLMLPLSEITEDKIKQCMQQDLARSFPFTAKVVQQPMPVWKLIVCDPEKIKQYKSKGGTPYNSATFEAPAAGFKIQNKSIRVFLENLIYYLDEKFPDPFIDQTDISFNLDLIIHADLTNLADTRRALQEIGLDLVPGKKEMKALIIHDKPFH